MPSLQNPVVLVFSGLDPSGGAGIQADIETLRSQACHPCPIVTVLTVQDSIGIKNLVPVSASLVIEQASVVMADFSIAAIKIGLIGHISLIKELRAFIDLWPDIPVILDPILASGNGASLADSKYIRALVEYLLPITHVLTPNHHEAQALAQSLGVTTNNEQDWADILLRQGCEYLLVSGGHQPTVDIVNRLYNGTEPTKSSHWPRLPGQYHGTGCTLAAALAGLIAHQQDLPTAFQRAQEYTWACVQHSYTLGLGQAFPNRFYWANTQIPPA